MWIFTEDGFLSVVEYSPPATSFDRELKKHVPFQDGILDKLPKDYHPADKATLSSHVLVRARVKEDLNALKEYDHEAVEAEDKAADYQFRLVIRRAALAQYNYDKVMLLDYDSHVKETIDKRASKIPGGRYAGLAAVWSAIARWQPNDPWGGKVSYGGYGGSYAPQSQSSHSYYDKSLGKWITKESKSKGGTTYYSGGKEVTASEYGKTNYSHGSEENYMPKAGNHNFLAGSGGADPKAITDGKSANVRGSDGFVDLDEALATLDADNPWTEPSNHLDLGIKTEDGLTVTADATRASMIAQVKDIVREMGRTCEVEALVDELQDTFGTCDIETIPRDILSDMTQEFESVSSILAGM